jgi:ABC-type sugar transport system ATPase subunit
MATVELAGIHKQFSRVVALDSVDLTVEDGSFTCLVGPSGSGKSTLLNIVAGFERPTGGTIRIDGRDVSNQPPSARDIAMVFQSYALYPHMTVYQNMSFGLEVRKTPARIVRERVAEAAELLQISGLLQRKPGQLSGGQRQRVALGRAITRHPKVFLLDEPLSNLDAQLRLQTRVELKLLFDRIGGTVIYVTHDQAEAMTLSDQVVVLNEGKVEQIGPPLDVYEVPDTSFVASFLGSPSMNLVRVNLETDDSAVRGLIPAHRASLLTREVVLGFRPEAVEVGAPDQFAVSARLQLIERLGPQDVIYLSVGEARVAAVTANRAVTPPGDGRLSVRVNPTALHFFDVESGRRIADPLAPVAGLPTAQATP